MKRNLRTMAVVFWVLFIVATLLIFLPARAAEEAERTEDRTETAPECTDRAIEAEPEEDFENEYIEAALYASGYFREDGTEYKTVSPVENCAFFEPGRRKKPAVETWRLAPAVAKIDYRLIYKLYLQGLTDRAVAEKVGCNVNTVWAWRKKNNLPANRYKKAHGASFS